MNERGATTGKYLGNKVPKSASLGLADRSMGTPNGRIMEPATFVRDNFVEGFFSERIVCSN